MRTVLYALIGLTATVVAKNMGVCQKNCGIDYGKCLIQTFDVTQCIKDEASCALDCLKGKEFAAKHNNQVVKQGANGKSSVCVGNCASNMLLCHQSITPGLPIEVRKQKSKCDLAALQCVEACPVIAVTPFDEKACDGACQIRFEHCASHAAQGSGPELMICTTKGHQCTQDCRLPKKVETKFMTPKVKQNMGVCQKNCGIDYGKCLIQTFDMTQCIKDEASCALDCLKGKEIVAKHNNQVVKNVVGKSGDTATCRSNCGIDQKKCMIIFNNNSTKCYKEYQLCSLDCQKQKTSTCQSNCTTDNSICMLISGNDRTQCFQKYQLCNLDCQKRVQVHAKRSNQTMQCSLCQDVVMKAEKILSSIDCNQADSAISNVCKETFGGPLVSIQDVCAGLITEYCPAIKTIMKDHSVASICARAGFC